MMKGFFLWGGTSTLAVYNEVEAYLLRQELKCFSDFERTAHIFFPKLRSSVQAIKEISELMGSVTFEMLEDKLVLLIQDNGVFIAATIENNEKYNEEFYPVTAEGIEAYRIELKEDRLISC